jgi:hypothetical protein
VMSFVPFIGFHSRRLSSREILETLGNPAGRSAP